jgi:hypothetical protein
MDEMIPAPTAAAMVNGNQKKQRHEAKNLEKSIEKTIETLFRCSLFVDEGFRTPPTTTGHNRSLLFSSLLSSLLFSSLLFSSLLCAPRRS